jgi:hypothetical protein
VKRIDEGDPMKKRLRRFSVCFAAVVLACASTACSRQIRRSGMPADARTALDTAIDDIDAGRYEKLYREAAEEWRNQVPLEESKATFQKLRDKLGKVRSRDLQTMREEQTSTGPVRGHSLIVVYQATFDQTRGTPPESIKGIETFTLLERGGRWYLARYFVSSDALK